ncbi:MAG: SAM-dependent chlorinase/fluorinase [Eubacteriales bacterium]|nr:SAM-dependent chlorinase/fluorinase [Eubacteriales bacterium]
MKKAVSLLLVLLLLCAALPAWAQEAPLAGTIDAADKHGNVSTTLPAADLFARCALGDLLVITIGDQRITAPLVRRYSDVNTGEPLVFENGEGMVALAINYKSFQDTYGAQPGTAFTLELLEAGAYLEQYEIRNLVKSESRDDYASDEIFANFRPVIEGVLYRGANPILADDARAPYVMALVEAAGVKTVVNLAQTMDELEGDPYGGRDVIAVGMGTDPQGEGFAPALKTALEFMASHDGPYFIHCNEGKDRAGMVCALLEGLIGFTPEEITADYMTSYVNYYGVEEGTEKYALLAQQIQTLMETMTSAPMNADTLSQRVEAYLTDTVGLSGETLQTLRERLKN